MPLTPKNLYRGQPGVSNTTLYTAPSGAGLYTIVKQITIHNTHTASVSIQFHSVAAAGSPSAANRFFDYILEPQETVTIDLSMVLSLSEFLSAVAASASKITVHVSGVEAS